jgi:hypothetical protein
MNLRELLLQFAGENDISLKVENIVTTSTNNIYVLDEISNGVKVGLLDNNRLEETKKVITEKLVENGYKVHIYNIGDNILDIEVR